MVCSFQKIWTSHCLHDKNQLFVECLVSFNGITSKFFFYSKEVSFIVWSRKSALIWACIWPSSICQFIQTLCFVHLPLCIHLNHQWLLWKMKLSFFVSHQQSEVADEGFRGEADNRQRRHRTKNIKNRRESEKSREDTKEKWKGRERQEE